MADSESFEAFYARTVWNVTSQMHALAGEDNAADHAIREAYARAYQQWYEIAGYPDSEGWVLAVAKEAYQRRRPGAAAPLRDLARPGHDPLSMPGMFRPPAVPDKPAGPAEATAAPSAPRPDDGAAGGWFSGASRPSGAAEGDAGTGPARGISGVFGDRSGAPGSGTAAATAQLADERPAVSAQPTQPGEPARPGRLDRFTVGGRRPTASLIALVIVVALAAAGGVAYLATGRHPGARHGADTAHRKPAVQMLAAGRTGTLSAIPWTLVGAGWTLAEMSTAAPGPNGTATGSGTVTTYLVDPKGGKYQVQTSPGAAPILLAWSGNAQTALFAVPLSGGGVTYDLLSVQTGSMSPLPLPPGVTAVGFTRPDGLNILAVSQTTAAFKLERFNLQGAYQATIGSLPRKPGMAGWQPGCGVSSCALSSPGGLFAVWGAAGDEMQLLSNAGGLIRRLAVPDSGSPPSCVPLSWWNGDTVAAYCFAPNSVVGRIWLVPITGAAPTALTGPAGSMTGSGVVTGAWHGPGVSVYATQTDAQLCAGAATGPGGLALATVSGGTLQPVGIRGTTNNDTTVVSASDGRLLLLAETSCPGASSLLWLNPATGTTQTVLSAPAGEAGVLAAAPFGMGPTALGVGLAG